MHDETAADSGDCLMVGCGDYVSIGVAALARDGAVVGSDSRETKANKGSAPSHLDDAKKLFVCGPALAGVAGAGAWFEQISRELRAVGGSLDVGRAIYERVSADRSIHAFHTIVVTARHGDPIVVIEPRGDKWYGPLAL